MADEQFHEFQLDGKGLVFAFMAATVVLVVVFLCGVLVGQGTRGPRNADPALQAASTIDPTEPDASDDEAAAPLPAGETEAAAAHELSYPDRLTAPAPPPETLSEPVAPARVAEPSPPPPPPRAQNAASAPPEAPPVTTARPATAGGYEVQVLAVTGRAEAETVAKRLASKQYPSFVSPAPDGRFRVRVGPYADRNEALSVARRLEREEKFTGSWLAPVAAPGR